MNRNNELITHSRFFESCPMTGYNYNESEFSLTVKQCTVQYTVKLRIEAGPRLQAGSRIQAERLVKCGCCLLATTPCDTFLDRPCKTQHFIF